MGKADAGVRKKRNTGFIEENYRVYEEMQQEKPKYLKEQWKSVCWCDLHAKNS